MLREGMHQAADHAGVAPYRPNSLDGGRPFKAGADLGAFVDVPEAVAEAIKQRKSPASFDDHQPGAAVLPQPYPGGTGSRGPGLYLRTGEVLREARA
jgi:hypothetical protein